MLKKLLMGVSALAVIGAGYLGVTASAEKAEEPRVICCGECKPGEDCLKRCEVVGQVPSDLALLCCGNCEKGDDCLEKCGGKSASCCEAK